MVNVGRVARSHGKKGELRLRFYELRPAELGALSAVYIGREGAFRRYEVESWAPKGRDCDLKLRGVETLSQADGLAGLEVFVPEEHLKPPAAGTYYIFQLVGCSVADREGKVIGQVKDLLSVGPGDLLVVEKDGKEILIPFHESICFTVDLAKKEIVIDPPEGLLELNEV